jgi:hypothetical protein
MSSVQNNGNTTGGVTGKGFRPGQSGNPGGRPKGLAKAIRELVGEDGMALVELWLQIAMDPLRRDADRLRASELLADRGWGKAAAFQPVEEDDPLGLADLEAGAEEFRRRLERLVRERIDADGPGDAAVVSVGQVGGPTLPHNGTATNPSSLAAPARPFAARPPRRTSRASGAR